MHKKGRENNEIYKSQVHSQSQFSGLTDTEQTQRWLIYGEEGTKLNFSARRAMTRNRKAEA